MSKNAKAKPEHLTKLLSPTAVEVALLGRDQTCATDRPEEGGVGRYTLQSGTASPEVYPGDIQHYYYRLGFRQNG